MIDSKETARQALARVELRNPPYAIEMSIEGNYLQIATWVNHRVRGEAIRLNFMFALSPMREDVFFEWVAGRVRATMLHEFEEAFHVDGHRVYDPHADDPVGTFRVVYPADPYERPLSTERAFHKR